MAERVMQPSVGRLSVTLITNALLRVAGAAAGAVIVFYLKDLAASGHMIDAGIVGVLGVIFSLSELVGAVPIGMLTDRFSPRALLVASALLAAVATYMFGLSTLVVVFFLARAVQGVMAASGGPALLAHLTDITERVPAWRSRVMGMYELSLLAGIAVGGLVGGVLWDRVGLHAFTLLAVLYLVIAALFFWSTADAAPRKQTHHENPFAGLRSAVTDPMLRRLAPAWLAMNAVIGMWLTHIPFQLKGPAPAVPDQFLPGRFTASEVGYILLGYAIFFAIGVLIWSFPLAKTPRMTVLRVSLLAILAMCGLIFVVNSAPALPPLLRWLIVGVMAVTISVQSGFTPAALAYLSEIAGQSEGRGAAMGVYTLLLGLGSAIGAAFGGILARSFALNGLLLGTVVLITLAWFALSLLHPTEAQPAAIKLDTDEAGA